MLITYIIGSLGLIIKPGPDLLCTLATALTHGRRRAICLMTGLITGCWFWIVLLALGAAAFLKTHALVMSVIRYGGMAYIAYLAYGCYAEAWKGFNAPKGLPLSSPVERGLRLFVRGIVMAMSNPLTIMFFLAFLPHFTAENSALAPSVQIFLLGTLFCLLVPFVYIPIICGASAFKKALERYPKFAPAIKLFSGLLLTLVVILLGASDLTTSPASMR